jgi:gas vesicle protein
MKNFAYIIVNDSVKRVEILETIRYNSYHIDENNIMVDSGYDVQVIQYKNGKKDLCDFCIYESKEKALAALLQDQEKYLKTVIENKNKQLKYIEDIQKHINTYSKKIAKIKKQLKVK